jgi:copper chaperone CopZ
MFRAFMSAAALTAALGTVITTAPGCEAKVQAPTGPGTITVHVHGLANPADVAKVQKALEAVPGVTKVKVDKDGSTAIAVADQAVTTPAKLVKAIGDAGYNGHAGGH